MVLDAMELLNMATPRRRDRLAGRWVARLPAHRDESSIAWTNTAYISVLALRN